MTQKLPHQNLLTNSSSSLSDEENTSPFAEEKGQSIETLFITSFKKS